MPRVFALWLLLLVPYWPLLLGRVVYHRDVVRFMYPVRWFIRDAVWHGELPLWNPHQGLGFAVLGDPLYGLFYPINWLLWLPGPLPQMLAWFSFGHLLLGATGCMLLASRLGATGTASIVAGLAWGLSGFTTSEWTAGFRMLAGAYIPWCALGFVYLAGQLKHGRRASVRAVLVAALPVALALLLGEVFLAIMAVGFGVLVTLSWWFAQAHGVDASRSKLPALSHTLAALGCAIALGCALSAVSVVPAARFAGTTQRARALSRDVAEGWSVHPLRTTELLVPGIFGPAWEEHPRDSWVPRILGSDPLALSIYGGAAVIGLALLALRRRVADDAAQDATATRLGAALAALFGLVLLVSLGSWTPVHGLLRRLIPPLAYMRYPEKYLVLVVATLSLLAALGAARSLSTQSRTPPWPRLFALTLLIAGCSLGAGALFPAGLVPYVQRGAWHAGAALLGLMLSLLLAQRRPQLGRALLLVCVAADLGSAVVPIQRFGEGSQLAARPPLAAAIEHDAQAHSIGRRPAPRLYRGNRVAESIAERVGPVPALLQLRDNTSVPLGIDILPGYDAAIPVTFTNLVGIGRVDVLRVLGVHYALLTARAGGPERVPAALDYISEPFAGARLFRVKDPLPRAYVAYAIDALPEGASLTEALAADVVSGARALVPRGTLSPIAQAAGPSSQAPARGTCTIEHYGENGLDARCDARAPGLAVFVEQWAVGWQATVDGVAAPVIPTNFACRGVAIGAGPHRITLRYQPPGLRVGALITCLALLVVFAGYFWARRQP